MAYRTPNATTQEHPANREPAANRSPQAEYAAKLTTAERAVRRIADGSTLCLALAVGMPGGLAKVVADRITGGDMKGLDLYYQHSMPYSEATLIRPEVLSKVDARCFFISWVSQTARW
jgi:hypothetical protein